MGGILGGKGGAEPPPPMPAMQDNTAQYMQMMQGMMESQNMMMSNLMASMAAQQMPQIPDMTLPEMPLPDRTPAIDWAEKQDQLARKMRADYNVDEARRKGRLDTVLTSPLLDDEEVETTGSVLAGND